MSGIVILTPVLISAWPTLAAAAAAAAAHAGFKVVAKPAKAGLFARKKSTEITMENLDVVADTLSHDNRIVVERDGVTVIFSRDAAGHFKTCVEGSLPEDQLKAIGEELAGKVVQNYVYRRLTDELKGQGFLMVEEGHGPDESIELHVRRMG